MNVWGREKRLSTLTLDRLGDHLHTLGDVALVPTIYGNMLPAKKFCEVKVSNAPIRI